MIHPSSGHSRGAWSWLLMMILTCPATADLQTLDADEVAALLGDLEAFGGILDEEDLLLIEEALRETVSSPVPSLSGLWTSAVDWRQNNGLRVDSRLRCDDRRLRVGARWRGEAQERQLIAWAQTGGGFWQLSGGGGGMAHGSGLLTASLGSRSSLGVDSSLLPTGAGWRPSLAVTMPARLAGMHARIEHGSLGLDMGMARDLRDQPAQHLRFNWGEAQGGHGDHAISAGMLGLRRGDARGGGLDLRWRRGPWRLTTEAGVWRTEADHADGRAWVVVAGWRQRFWRAEFQAGGSRAAGAMPGAQRPVCLPGWHGSGWALRLNGRPSARFRLGLAAAEGQDRDLRRAAGSLRARQVLVLSASGSFLERGKWEVRWRRQDETRRNWDPLQPWMPAREDRRRSRQWLVAQTEHPTVAGGTLQVSGRRLEEAHKARNLLGFRWRRTGGSMRYGAGWQMAWGDPLDLVTVSAPVSSMIRLRHWGSWDSGLQLGIEARGRWRWQAGVEVRRRSKAAGGDLVGEGRFLWGRSF